MKMFKFLIILVLSTTFHHVKAITTSGPIATDFDLELFLKPLQMTSAGLHCFFTQLYNSKRYTEDFFPNNFKNPAEFLRHGKQTNQQRDYTKSIFTIFGQKIKGCLYVSSYVFTDFLAELPNLVDYHFQDQPHSLDQKKRAIKQVLYQEFLNNFSQFKENPSTFFDNLSDSILQKTDPDLDQSVNLEYLRQTIIRFVDTSLSKLLWDSTDREIWSNVKEIGDHLNRLVESNVIVDLDDLNDLYWTLVHRFCYFIDITGSDLPLEFYEQVRNDLQYSNHNLLTLEEQEELAESKKHHLERIIMDGIAKKHANLYGIVTDRIPV